MKLVCISDTHSLHRQIPEILYGDVLIHAGDCLGAGTLDDVEDLNHWLGTLPHRHKILIAGNHDSAFQEMPDLAREALTNAIYLEDSGVEIEGIRFWGSPWTPTFQDWNFMLDRGQPLHEKWKAIPDDTDVLITHGPPRSIGDEVSLGFRCFNAGCIDLLHRIDQLTLKAHIFGHIHEGYGEYVRGATRLINASTCTVRYKPTNPPIALELECSKERDAIMALKGADRFQKLIANAGGTVSSQWVSEFFGISEEAILKRARSGALIARLTTSGELSFPRFQFGEDSARLLPGMSKLLAKTQTWAPEELIRFLLVRHEPASSDDTPLKLIQRGEIDRVLELARVNLQQRP